MFSLKTQLRILKTLKNHFLAGLFILLPLGVTVIVVDLLLDHVGAPVSQLILNAFGLEIPDKFWMNSIINLFSTIFVVVIITLLGWFSKYFLGRTFIKLAEQFINGVPFVCTVYKTVKQVVDTFNKNRSAVFQTTVLLEYPRKGMYAIGFLTSETEGEAQVKTEEQVVNVFLPTTPNPTSGFLLLVPKKDVIYLDMTVSDGMKMIISGGVVNPEYLPRKGQSRRGNTSTRQADGILSKDKESTKLEKEDAQNATFSTKGIDKKEPSKNPTKRQGISRRRSTKNSTHSTNKPKITTPEQPPKEL